jgi:hypothetical protein
MTALEAARMGDEVGHSSAMAGLIAGAIAGLAIGAAILFTVVTAGAGAVLIGAAIAGGIGLGAGGALAGMEIGKLFDGKKCSKVKTGSPDTFIESKQAARAKLDLVSHNDKKCAQGSVSVFVNAANLMRRTEKAECGGKIAKACNYTFIGGDTITLVPIEEDVPSWLVTGLKWTAWIAGGAALVLTGIGAGVMVAGLGLIGSVAGGYIFGKLGHAIGGLWGERAARVGEILGEFGGALVGGVVAVKMGMAISTPKAAPKIAEPEPIAPKVEHTPKVEPPAPKLEAPKVETKLGDLRPHEIQKIQRAADITGEDIYITGSAAKGTRRNLDTDLPLKGFGSKLPKNQTRSDIDYAVRNGADGRVDAMKLPDADPSFGVRGVDYINLKSSPAIRFRPNQPPEFLPQADAKVTLPTPEAPASLPKFADYVFKEGATHGKAAPFEKLGYNKENSADLARMWEQQGNAKYEAGEYTLGKADQYGQRINIEIEVPGVGDAAGQMSYMKSGWMIQPDGSIKLNTPFAGFTR